MLKILGVGAALIATAALAQAPADTQKPAVSNGDLNQIVCVNQRETGSRVSSRRVCRTRAEWAELEAQTRQNLNRTQSFKPVVCGEGAGMKC
jgi:hypothetical protein